MPRPRNHGSRFALYAVHRPQRSYWLIQISWSAMAWQMSLPYIPEQRAVQIREFLRTCFENNLIKSTAHFRRIRSDLRDHMNRIGWTYSCRGGQMPAPCNPQPTDNQ